MTKYVVTRWYRAPEVLLACQYTSAIDMWSVGCILAELLGRKPLFQGNNHIQQLENIIRALGQPSEDEMSFVTDPKARSFLRSIPVPEDRKTLRQQFPDANHQAVDLLKCLLKFDPRKRISANEALQHPWLALLHEEKKEPSAPVTFEFDFEENSLSTEEIRSVMVKEIQLLKARNLARCRRMVCKE